MGYQHGLIATAGILPAIVTGTSAESIVGAGVATGMSRRGPTDLARGVFWSKLLHGATLERFCRDHPPHQSSDLRLPFAAIATALPRKRAVAITTGNLASAINASCAMRVVGRRVPRNGHAIKDGGIACVLPADF